MQRSSFGVWFLHDRIVIHSMIHNTIRTTISTSCESLKRRLLPCVRQPTHEPAEIPLERFSERLNALKKDAVCGFQMLGKLKLLKCAQKDARNGWKWIQISLTLQNVWRAKCGPANVATKCAASTRAIRPTAVLAAARPHYISVCSPPASTAIIRPPLNSHQLHTGSQQPELYLKTFFTSNCLPLVSLWPSGFRNTLFRREICNFWCGFLWLAF